MPATTEPRSSLKYGWTLGENAWKNDMDANLLSIGQFAYHLSVKDRDLATPPGSPAAGDTYIVAASPTGSWAGQASKVAIWSGTAWIFGTPRTGWRTYIEDEDAYLVYKAGAWGSMAIGAGEWTAATVDQAEAEAGTATTRRAWTAERVRQAIAAWWQTVVGTVLQQSDIGTAPNEIPLNQHLGGMAYQSPDSVVIRPPASANPQQIGSMVFQLTNDTTLVVKVKGSDGTVRSNTLTLT